MPTRGNDTGPPLHLSALEEDVLTLLVGYERYGLEIMAALKEAGGRKVNFGSLYPTLHKLEKKGYVASRWGEDMPEERGHARRRYYQATGLGERVLAAQEGRRQGLKAWRPAWGEI